MNQFPKVNIIILNYNGKDCLKKCLGSLFRLEYPNVEIVVVDNNSQDGSFELAKTDFPKITYIKNEQNLGFSAGNNVGIKYSLEKMADFVLLLNNDTEVEKDFLNQLIIGAVQNENVGIASPLIFTSGKKEVWFSGGRIDWLRMKTLHKKRKLKKDYFDSDFISGCAMLVKSEVFKKIGLLDEDFFLYWEDADFSVRAKKAGFEILVVANSTIVHHERSEKQKKNKIYWLVFSGLLFFFKNTPIHFRPWIFVYLIARKLKNSKDVFRKESEISLTVKKAYQDFKLFKKDYKAGAKKNGL